MLNKFVLFIDVGRVTNFTLPGLFNVFRNIPFYFRQLGILVCLGMH